MLIAYDASFNDKAAAMDLGLTMGVLPFEKLQAEVGIDLFFPYWNTFFQPAGALLNAKAGLVEGAYGEWFRASPRASTGVGADRAPVDILHGEIGKTFFFGASTWGVTTGPAGPTNGATWTGWC